MIVDREQAEMKIIKPHEDILIQQKKNGGWIVTIGKEQFAFANVDKMLGDTREYIVYTKEMKKELKNA